MRSRAGKRPSLRWRSRPALPPPSRRTASSLEDFRASFAQCVRNHSCGERRHDAVDRYLRGSRNQAACVATSTPNRRVRVKTTSVFGAVAGAAANRTQPCAHSAIDSGAIDLFGSQLHEKRNGGEGADRKKGDGGGLATALLILSATSMPTPRPKAVRVSVSKTYRTAAAPPFLAWISKRTSPTLYFAFPKNKTGIFSQQFAVIHRHGQSDLRAHPRRRQRRTFLAAQPAGSAQAVTALGFGQDALLEETVARLAGWFRASAFSS